jgi:predicted GNAT family acetyltransferase
MENFIELKFESPSKGGFYIFDNENQIAEIEFSLAGKVLDAYHTGVREELEGQGVAARLLNALVSYARDNEYKIVPSCSYVLAKFNRHPEEYADVWSK